MSADAPLDLVAEHLACDVPGRETLAWLVRRGVPLRTISPEDGVSLLLRADVVVTRRGVPTFEFARHSGAGDRESALVFPVWDQCGDNVDLAAWCANGVVALWLGRVAMLGEEQVDRRWRALGGDEGPLQVHATVLDWMRAGRRGVVVIDQARAAPLLRGAGPLLVGDVAFGTRLERALTVRAPKILVREAA